MLHDVQANIRVGIRWSRSRYGVQLWPSSEAAIVMEHPLGNPVDVGAQTPYWNLEQIYHYDMYPRARVEL